MANVKKLLLHAFLGAGVGVLALGVAGGALQAQEKTLKIGVLGVMSGPAAMWGLVNRYSAEATANMYNAKGGVEIGGVKYKIEVVSIDDRNDPKIAVTGAERLVYEEGIKYIIGPNVDTTAAAIVPVIEKAGAVNFTYAFSKDIYLPPRGNSFLSMIASYQAGPVIYKYLMEKEGVKSVSFVARNETDPLNQRDYGTAAANLLGLKVQSSEDTYEPGTTDFFPVMSRVVAQNADLIVLSGVTTSDAALMMRSARELGYQGVFSTETAQDAKVLSEVAGSAADGFVSVGGASTPTLSSDYMKAFTEEYVKVAGEWNDEAGTKVYALEIILETLKQAPAGAVTDVEKFKATIPGFAIENQLLKGENTLKYVGADYFQQPRQISVPMVVNVFKDGNFETLFVGSVE